MSLEEDKDSSLADDQQVQINEAETEDFSLNQADTEVKQEKKSEDNFSEFKGKGIIDQELYNEVLEKLDIVKRQDKQEIQESMMQKKDLGINSDNIQKSEKSQIQIQIEKTLVQDFAKIQKLTQAGLINSVQGQNLKKQVLKKAFDKIVQTEKIKKLSPATRSGQENQVINHPIDKSKALEEFSNSNPDFFNPDGRKEVLDFLKSDGILVGKDELNKISNIVRIVEKAAIDRYLNKTAYEKNLKESNDVAKQRLTANAQKSGFSDKNFSRKFTREQIGKMSSAEFTKYEPIIMEQLKKGFIR